MQICKVNAANTIKALLWVGAFLPVLLLCACGAEPSNECRDFCLIENFDDLVDGSIRDQNHWVANPPGPLDGAIVTSSPPSGFMGKAMMSDAAGVPFRGNSYKPLDSSAINEGAVGTLFFQVLADDLTNTYSHFGLTDIPQPRLTDNNTGELTIYTDFEVQMSLDHGRMRVRNGNTNSHLTNISVESGVVYNVWMVVDNLSDTWEIYIQGGAQATPVKGSAGGVSVFPFRHGTNGALQTLYLIHSPDNVDVGTTYIDSIYLDASGVNLSSPI